MAVTNVNDITPILPSIADGDKLLGERIDGQTRRIVFNGTDITTLGTIVTGVWNASTIATSYGGSGRTSATAYTPLIGGTTSTAAHQSMTSSSTAGQLVASGGASAVPVWTTPTYPTTSATSGKLLRSDGTNFLSSTSTFADTYSASTLLYSNGANTVTGLATANSGVLVTSGGGVPSIATDIPTAVTIGGGAIYRAGGTDVAVADGGTGTSSAGIGAFNNITGFSAAGSTGTTSTNLVFSTSPTLVTPTLGAATATSINKVAFTAPSASATITVADGKTLTCNNSLTLSATDGATIVFGVGGTVSYAGVASQSDQETATRTDAYVSPGRQQFHPSSAKAWVHYTSVTTTAIIASYGVTSLTDNGTGRTQINFTTAFSSANYGASATAEVGGVTLVANTVPAAAGSLEIRTYNTATAEVDTVCRATCWGDV